MSIGFIILRHVNTAECDKLWKHSYDCIRRFYPENVIVIIDDNSNQKYITKKELYKTTIINSTYHGRGELLPYYYFLRYVFFDTAVIIHDSVFINQWIDFTTDTYQILWNFEHLWDNPEEECKILQIYQNEELLQFYHNKSLWTGCFGGMTVVTHSFLRSVHEKFPIEWMLDRILSRHERTCFERIIGCLLQFIGKGGVLLGNIHQYMPIGISFDNKTPYEHLPITKVWVGR